MSRKGYVSILVMLAMASISIAKVKIIFDTDMSSDCDDAGALAVLHALADKGEAEILGVVVCSHNYFSPGCVDAIDTGYNSVSSDGSNVWKLSPDKDHEYLIKEMDPSVLADIIENLMIQPPVKASQILRDPRQETD